MSETNRYIVFVDDDPDDREIMQLCTRELNIDEGARFLASGTELLDFLNSLQYPAAYPSLVVLDFNMPVMDGAQTLLRLRRDKRFATIPVVLFSTGAQNLTQFISQGVDGVHQKPSDYKGMLQKVSGFFERLEVLNG